MLYVLFFVADGRRYKCQLVAPTTTAAFVAACAGAAKVFGNGFAFLGFVARRL